VGEGAEAGGVARKSDSSYTIAMEVQFTPEIEARLV